MDYKTQKYYSSRAKEIASLYDSCADKGISKYFSTSFVPGSKILVTLYLKKNMTAYFALQ